MRRVVLLVVVCLLAVGCDSLTRYSSSCDLESGEWLRGESVAFAFRPTSITQRGDIKISLRYNHTIEDSSMMLYVKTACPARNIYYTDTLPVTLAKNTKSRLNTLTVQYRENVQWLSVDKHTISLSTSKDTAQILAVSLEVKNAQNL